MIFRSIFHCPPVHKPITPTYLYGNPKKPTETDRHLRQINEKPAESHFPNRFTTWYQHMHIESFELSTISLVLVINRPRNRPVGVRFWFRLFSVQQEKNDRNRPTFRRKNEKTKTRPSHFRVRLTTLLLLYQSIVLSSYSHISWLRTYSSIYWIIRDIILAELVRVGSIFAFLLESMYKTLDVMLIPGRWRRLLSRWV